MTGDHQPPAGRFLMRVNWVTLVRILQSRAQRERRS